MLDRASKPFVSLVEKYLPDPYLKAKDIMGYCLMLLFITGAIISIGLTWL
ncbi:TIGR00366 family protein [Marinobacter nauticus]|nr:TIGR00366 family protein [Marinobacter nauticus]